MPNPRLAERYARSLMDFSIEKDQLEVVHDDVLFLQEVCSRNANLVDFMKSPVIDEGKKEKVLDAAAKGRISGITADFNKLLVRKGRGGFLPEIVDAFIRLYKTRKEIYIVKLFTAAPISEELKKKIVDKIVEVTKMKNIELIAEVREDIIGGLVFEVGDLIVDASIGFDLNKIRQQFETNEYVYQIR